MILNPKTIFSDITETTSNDMRTLRNRIERDIDNGEKDEEIKNKNIKSLKRYLHEMIYSPSFLRRFIPEIIDRTQHKDHGEFFDTIANIFELVLKEKDISESEWKGLIKDLKKIKERKNA
jgi:hypothetical protein